MATSAVVVAVLFGPPAGPAAAQPAEADPVAVARRAGDAWLAGAQQPDGGFALGGQPGVETPEVVLAHAGEAQTSDVWSSREAIDAVEALGATDAGPTVPAALGALARATTSAQGAAVLITRVALPLGLDPTGFDPAVERQRVDLVALLDGATTEDPVAAMAEVVTARVALGEEPPADLVAAIADAARPDGTWAATAEDEAGDPTTTATALTALIAAGVPVADDPVAAGLRSLAAAQNDDGGWGAGGASTARATAAVMGALRAAGYDPDAPCWQQDHRDSTTTVPPPSASLTESQAEDGHWGSGTEAVSTAVAVQALGDRWLPLVRADERSCGSGLSWPLPTVPPAALVLAGIGVVGTFGAVRILRGQDQSL